MESLKRIVSRNPPELHHFQLDYYQESLLENLYLEFFSEDSRVLITPSLSFLSVGRIRHEEKAELKQLLASTAATLNSWRRYVIINLALYTALLETNSYYLATNDNLLICRFVALAGHTDKFILKLYTNNKEALITNYNDKLYLGRDRLNLATLRRKHFGLASIGISLIDQFNKLKQRLRQLVPAAETELYRRKHLEDLKENLEELARATTKFIEQFPDSVFTHDLDIATLLAASFGFRNLKHILIEIEETLEDVEKILLNDGHPKGARYVTRLRKDVTNYINFIMVKINARVSNVVNRIDPLAYFSATPTEEQ